MTASIAMVTGGASGIGREVAARLRAAGHDVVVWDLSGGDIACDVSDPDAVTAAMGGGSQVSTTTVPPMVSIPPVGH